MDTEAAKKMLREARAELSDTRVRVAHLEQVVDGLTGLLNAAGVDVKGKGVRDKLLPSVIAMREAVARMRPRDAALHVLGLRPGLSWTPRRLYEYLEQNDMLNSEVRSGIAAYDMALRRLADESDSGVERDDESGTYTLRPGLASSSAARNKAAHMDRRLRESSDAANADRGRVLRDRPMSGMEAIAAEHHRRQLEEQYGVETRPNSAAKKRGDDV